MPLRILHFSDFHLSPKTLTESQGILLYMKKALAKDVEDNGKIDLVVFTGDMLMEGTKSYKDLAVGFQAFKDEVIKPLLQDLNLPDSRFIFTPGNHDINRNADSLRLEKDLESSTTTLEGIVQLTKAPDVNDFTKRVDAFKTFERQYYEGLDDINYNYGKFVSTFELDINGISVGISSLNTVWRCGENDAAKICLGINQITEHTGHLQRKEVKIALSHYHYEYLKMVERGEVKKKLAKEFDMSFTGHSHSGHSDFIVPYRNYSLLDINSAGTLASNVYEHDSRYKNAFQIVDVNPGCSYEIRTYKQIDYQEFEIDRTEYPDGKRTIPFLNAVQNANLFEAQNIREQENLQKLVRQSISPFQPIDDYFANLGQEIMKGEYIHHQKENELTEFLASDKQQLRISALSGMGKTRMVAEALKGRVDVYYSPVGNCVKELGILLSSDFKIGCIVIDNCEVMNAYEAMEAVRNSGKCIKLITIYNVVTPNETATSGQLLKLQKEDVRPVVSAMISREDLMMDMPGISKLIEEKSGDIPYMTKLMLNAYKADRTLSIEDPDKVLTAILQGHRAITEEQRKVMNAISLFEPLGRSGPVKDELAFVINSRAAHHIQLNQDTVANVFNDTIEDYVKRQLIEVAGDCLRIRPRPLAEWLTESWIRNFGSSFADLLSQILASEGSLSDRLFRALNKRFSDMAEEYPQAKALFDECNNTENGFFHDERIAFSAAGSQLFLSMGEVSPVAVSKNILSLLEARPVEWLKENLAGDARREIVWALENLSKYELSFEFTGKALARLAISENENYGNNATAQFVQLFHIELSGTKATLSQRVSLLQELRKDEAYLSLIISAIQNAFKARDFHRSNTTGIRDREDVSRDYMPQLQEVHFYWRDCADLLKYVVEQDESLLEQAMSILPDQVYDFHHIGEMPLLFSLIEYFGAKVNNDWPQMRDALSMCRRHWIRNDRTYAQQLDEWISRLEPKTFWGRLQAAQKDDRFEIGEDYAQYNSTRCEQMRPYAEEFVKDKVYDSEELELMMDQDSFSNYWFIRKVADIISEDIDSVNEVYAAIDTVVHKKDAEYESSFVVSLARMTKITAPVTVLQEDLYESGYYRLSAALQGLLDTEECCALSGVIKDSVEGRYDARCVHNYLRNYKYTTLPKVVEIFEAMRDGGVDRQEVCYPFILDYITYTDHDKFKEMGLDGKIETLLLDYEYDDVPSHGHTANEVVQTMIGILEKSYEPDFAVKVQDRIIEVLSGQRLADRPFERIYFTLLPKYQEVLLDKLLETLAAEDYRFGFFLRMYHQLGSGFGFGKGPLFQCDEGKLKDACRKYPSVLPWRMAMMCPVYEYVDGKPVGFSPFFIWLCDEFGDNQRVLNEFSANMGTYSWCGIGGMSGFLEIKIPFFDQLLDHPNPRVRDWAQAEQKNAIAAVENERKKEAYEEMVRG